MSTAWRVSSASTNDANVMGVQFPGIPGVILGSSGHVRVTVEANEAKVDYVRSIVPGVTRADLENGAVEHSYTVKSRR